MTLDPGSYLEALAADSEALAGAADGSLDRAVPACPGWVVGDLVGHLGGVYSFAAAAVEAGGERPAKERAQPPEDRSGLTRWFLEQRANVLDALSGREPGEPAWSFSRRGAATAGWWRRRQALETAVHLFDVQTAAGRHGTVGPELAADGIDETLSEILPAYLERRPVAALTGTLHLHATDTPGEWHVDLSAPGLGFRREHAKADTALRGPAAPLYLWLWNRAGTEEGGIETFGDASVVGAWGQVRL